MMKPRAPSRTDRILSPSPASSVSVGHVWLEKIRATFSRLRETPSILEGVIFSAFRRVQLLYRASLRSPIFNISVVTRPIRRLADHSRATCGRHRSAPERSQQARREDRSRRNAGQRGCTCKIADAPTAPAPAGLLAPRTFGLT